LNKLYIIVAGESDSTVLDPGLALWLAHSRMPSLEALYVENCGGESPVVSAIFNALRANNSVCNVQKIVVQASFTNDNDCLADILLDILPQLSPKLQHLSFLVSSRWFVPQVAKRLETRQYHPLLPSTLGENLRHLYYFCSFWENRSQLRQAKEKMIGILRVFKRLSVIPTTFDSRCYLEIDRQVDYLLRINYGGGRILIPETTTDITGGSSRPFSRTKDCPSLQCVKRPFMPPSLWPRVIERAGKDPGIWCGEVETAVCSSFEANCRPMDGTCIFRLLRPNSNLVGPALEGILNRDDEDDGGSYEETQDTIRRIIARSERFGVFSSTKHLLQFSRELQYASENAKRQKSR
jgi:hypothetical protein